MNKPLHKKGHIFVWIGFLGLFLAKGIAVIANSRGLGSLLYLAFFILFVYGNLLVLKSKNRSWAWIVLVFIPPIIGAIVIFMLKDESAPEATVPSTQVPPTPTV